MGSQDQTPQGVLRRRVREFRERRGWNQTQLAEEVTKLGTTMHQTTIAKIENQNRDVTINEALLLAAALNVPPPLLLLGVGTEDRVQITPKSKIHPQLAWEWLAGESQLVTSERRGIDSAGWLEASEPLRLYAVLRPLQAAVKTAYRERMQAEYVKDEKQSRQARQKEAEALNRLLKHREAMARAGVKPPKLPREWIDTIKRLGLEGGI